MNALPTVLLIGYKGQVGTEVSSQLKAGNYTFDSLGREECDLARRGEIGRFIRDRKPHVIVNASAYTAVDKAESEPKMAESINAMAPTEMAEAAQSIGSLFVHFSTDYIFDGNANRPWVEDDSPGPLNVYGQSKLEGERGVTASGAAAFIFRTSWVYGTHGANFLLTMLRVGRDREELSVIGDQIGAPTWSRNLADLTMTLIRKFTEPDGTIDLEAARAAAGIYQATSAGETSWHGFAQAIFDGARKRGLELKIRQLREIKSSDWPSAAKRPHYSVMSNEKLRSKLGYVLPDWRSALHAAMQELP